MKHHRIHNFFAVVLIALASLSFALTAVAAWAHQTALVTDRFVGVVSDVTSDPQVVDKLSSTLADQVVAKLALQQRLENLLPDVLDRLAAPLTSTVHDRIETASSNLLSSPEFQARWVSALTRVHAGFLNVVNGNGQFVGVVDGKLTVDLLAVVDAVFVQLHADGVIPTSADFPRFSDFNDRTAFLDKLGTAVQTQLPPDFGQIPIGDEAAVNTIANGLHLFDLSIVVLAVVTVVLSILAVWFAKRHWNAIFALGVGIEVFLALLWLSLLGLQTWGADSMASPDGRVVIGAFVARLAQDLTGWLAVIAVVVALIAVPAAFMARRSTREQTPA